jgi:hypothetical protein
MLQDWNSPFRNPYLVFALSLFVMLISTQVGIFLRKRRLDQEEDARQDLDVIVAATLTLLGLIIGFSFSMATNRYDQRKTYEEAEANAIGTEYVRADLLPAANANRVRALLKEYLEQRILFYITRDEPSLQQINASTSQLQAQLWSAVQVPSATQPTLVIGLTLSGMNDVLNSQGYTQAAWWNRIPAGAWGLMLSMAICSNLLVAYGAHRAKAGVIRVLILPFVLAIAFFFIADIDSPRRGVIRVLPQNLISVAQSMTGH